MFGRRMARKDQQRGAGSGSATGPGSTSMNSSGGSGSGGGGGGSGSNNGKLRRADVVKTSILAAFQSPLIGFMVLATLTLVVALVSKLYLVLCIPLLVGLVRYKILLYEFFLLLHLVEHVLGSWQWYTLVDTDLYLGSLPLESQMETFTKKLRLGAVLSINENFELLSTTLAGRPIAPADWKRLDITHLQLSSADYYPPSPQLLDQGADFINEQLTEGKKVYVHCKSGVGRSACMVCAYFIKYKRMDADAAHQDLISKRPVIFKKYARQMRAMRKYALWIRDK
jgi:atypical dual specificity phosphatase